MRGSLYPPSIQPVRSIYPPDHGTFLIRPGSLEVEPGQPSPCLSRNLFFLPDLLELQKAWSMAPWTSFFSLNYLGATRQTILDVKPSFISGRYTNEDSKVQLYGPCEEVTQSMTPVYPLQPRSAALMQLFLAPKRSHLRQSLPWMYFMGRSFASTACGGGEAKK